MDVEKMWLFQKALLIKKKKMNWLSLGEELSSIIKTC